MKYLNKKSVPHLRFNIPSNMFDNLLINFEILPKLLDVFHTLGMNGLTNLLPGSARALGPGTVISNMVCFIGLLGMV